METSVRLPEWLDNYIFNELGASYCPTHSPNMTVIDWGRKEILKYLGTYFPRSYAESYCIFIDYFTVNIMNYQDKEELSIFDFGCGTGGEIIGLLMVFEEKLPCLKKVDIRALDGNKYEMSILEKILVETQKHLHYQLLFKPNVDRIEDIYELGIQNSIIEQNFDLIISFKAICEFAVKQVFEKKYNEDEFYNYLNSNNPYQHIASFLLSKLHEDGLLLLEDITSPDKTTNEWLPNIMDKGLNAVDCSLICKNNGYSQTYKVTHSNAIDDGNKVAWRMIKR
jgi:SAM-dependent methyltransferase